MVGRQTGAQNYKNKVLIDIVGTILPNGGIGWQAVANAYHEVSKEKTVRDPNDLRRHWIKKLCNNMNKPTGRTGEPGDRIHRCMAIEKKIMNKTNSGMLGLGFSDDDDDDDVDDEDAALVDTEAAGGGGFEDSIQSSPSQTVPTIPPFPRRSPIRACRASGTTTSSTTTTFRTSDDDGEVEEDLTPRPTTTIAREALRRASSHIKANKTKNTTNKPPFEHRIDSTTANRRSDAKNKA